MKAVWLVIQDALKAFGEDKVPRLGAALAYNTIFSIAPLLILATGIAGLFVNQSHVEQQILGQIEAVLGKDAAHSLQEVLYSFASSSVKATLVGGCVLLWTASNFFVQLQDSLNTIWHKDTPLPSGFLRMVWNRLWSALMVLLMGLVALMFMGLSVWLSTRAASEFFQTPWTPTLLKLLNQVLTIAVYTVIFALIYRILPSVKLSWQDVLLGAVVTALLFSLGQYALGVYFAKASPASAFGAAGSLMALLLWVYFSAQILFFGAEITWAYSKRFGSVQDQDTTS